MLCDQNDGEHYNSLDSYREIVVEVETAIRFYPEVISQRKDVVWDKNEEELVDAPDGEGFFPIQCVCYGLYSANDDIAEYHFNLKAASFVVLLVQLSIGLNQFTKDKRGGLLIEDNFGDHTLENLVFSTSSRYDDDYKQLIDNLCLTQQIRLRRTDYFKKEDILDYNLFKNVYNPGNHFAERIRFLIEWNPPSLLQTNDGNDLPFHLATMDHFTAFTMHMFQLIFDYVIRFFSNNKGICLLLTKNYWNKTPFQLAVVLFGYYPVMKGVEDTLVRYVIDGTPLHVPDAFITLALDGNIHLHIYLIVQTSYHVDEATFRTTEQQ